MMSTLKQSPTLAAGSVEDRMSPRRSAVLVVFVALSAWAALYLVLRLAAG